MGILCITAGKASNNVLLPLQGEWAAEDRVKHNTARSGVEWGCCWDLHQCCPHHVAGSTERLVGSPWAGRSPCHLRSLGSAFHVRTPLVHLFLEQVFIAHCCSEPSAHHRHRDLTSLSYLTSIFPTKRKDSSLVRLKVWGLAANPPWFVRSHRLYVHSAVSNWKKCLHSIKLKDSVLSLV